MVRKKETKTRGETRVEFKNRAKKGLKLELNEDKKSSLDNLKSESENESEEEQFEIEKILDSKTKK